MDKMLGVLGQAAQPWGVIFWERLGVIFWELTLTDGKASPRQGEGLTWGVRLVGLHMSWMIAVSQLCDTHRGWPQPHPCEGFFPSHGSQPGPPDFFSFVLIPDAACLLPTGLPFRALELGPGLAPGIQAFKFPVGKRSLKK